MAILDTAFWVNRKLEKLNEWKLEKEKKSYNYRLTGNQCKYGFRSRNNNPYIFRNRIEE